MSRLFEVILTMINVATLKAARKGGGGTAKYLPVITAQTRQALAPSLDNVTNTLNHLTSVSRDLIDLSLNAIELVAFVPAKIVSRALEVLKRRSVVMNEKQAARFLQTV